MSAQNHIDSIRFKSIQFALNSTSTCPPITIQRIFIGRVSLNPFLITFLLLPGPTESEHAGQLLAIVTSAVPVRSFSFSSHTHLHTGAQVFGTKIYSLEDIAHADVKVGQRTAQNLLCCLALSCAVLCALSLFSVHSCDACCARSHLLLLAHQQFAQRE